MRQNARSQKDDEKYLMSVSLWNIQKNMLILYQRFQNYNSVCNLVPRVSTFGGKKRDPGNKVAVCEAFFWHLFDNYFMGSVWFKNQNLSKDKLTINMATCWQRYIYSRVKPSPKWVGELSRVQTPALVWPETLMCSNCLKYLKPILNNNNIAHHSFGFHFHLYFLWIKK